MNIFVAIVENRDDPMKIGRCQIRIFGKHTDDKTMLPTADLPWALPMQSITSAATSGVGLSPTGPVPGSWIVGFFIDGEDEQQPVMMGTIGSAAANNVTGSVFGAGPVGTGADVVLRDSDSNPINTDNIPQPSGWTLGQTSKKYESGGHGPGTINSYANSGDLGGASYGTYQFASYLPATMPSGKARPNPKNSPIVKYCSSSKFADKFAGLTPGTAEFDSAWKSCAAQYTADFEADQHAYIEANYYKVMIGKLKQKGLDLIGFGAGVQDLIWSTAVQFGPGRTDVFVNPLQGIPNLDDITIITKVSDYKIANVDNLFKSSSQSIKDGVRSRYIGEKAALLKLAAGYPAGAAQPVTPAAKEAESNAQSAAKDAPSSSPDLPYSPTADKTNTSKLVSTQTGYSDPDGVYPKRSYSDHSDVNKLATGRTDGTASELKSKGRAVGMALPDGESFDQPANTYNAKYPYNKVYESESGHVIEVDDTPGAERINVWHKSGTFMEIDAVGNMVRRSSASMYEIVDRNGYLYVQGKCNLSVGGSCNLMVAADANIEVIGDASISVGNDVTLEAAGRLTMSAGEAIDLRSKKIYIEADEDLHIVGDNTIHIQSNKADFKIDGPATISAASLDVKIDGAAVVQTGDKADFNVGGDLTLDTSGKLSLRASGDVRMDGSSFDWNVGGSNHAGTAADAEDAENSSAGLVDERSSYAEVDIPDLKQNTRIAALAMHVETPQEAAVAGPAITAKLVSQGIVSAKEIAVSPSTLGLPDISIPKLSIPALSIPGLGDLGHAIPGLGDLGSAISANGVMSTVTNVLTRVKKLDFPMSELAVVQKLLQSGVDIARLGSIPPTVNLNFDLGGIGLGKAVKIPGLNVTLLKKLQKLHLTEAEIKILKVVDLMNVSKMDLSSPQGVMNTLRGMSGKLTQFGVNNPEMNKAIKVIQNLTTVPAAFRVSPNFDIKGLTTGTLVAGDKIIPQFGLTESQIAANLTGVALNVIEPIKKVYPDVQVISGFRADNGMGYESDHFKGKAVDLRLPGASKSELFDFAKKVKDLVPFDQFGYESTSYGDGDWVHISFDNDGNNRGEVFTMFNHKKVGDGLIQLA